MGDVGEIFGEILPGCEGGIPCLVSEGYRFIDFILQLGKFVNEGRFPRYSHFPDNPSKT